MSLGALTCLGSVCNLLIKCELGSRGRCLYFLERAVKAAIGIFLSGNAFVNDLTSYSLAVLARCFGWDLLAAFLMKATNLKL